MAYVGLNDLLPRSKRIKKIQTGSELLLAYELGKYAKLFMGDDLVLTDVTIDKKLLKGEHFSFVHTRGLNTTIDMKATELADITRSLRLFFDKTVEGLDFVKVTDEEVVYNFDHNQQANLVLHMDNRSAGYVSLMAYLMIRALVDGKAIPKLVIDHKNYIQQEMEYVDLLILQNYGNRILDGMLDIHFSSDIGLQPDWEAFVMYNRQLGDMNREYTITEKARLLKKKYEVGDVVLLYSRSKVSKGRKITKLTSCYPAVINSIEGSSLKLTYYPIIQTRLTRYMELEDITSQMEDEDVDVVYSEDDYTRFISCPRTYDLTQIGIAKMTYDETDFIIDPVDFDGTYQYMQNEAGNADKVFMSTLEAIFAVFEDREIEYNKEKFLETHFANRTPIYTEYQERLIEYAKTK